MTDKEPDWPPQTSASDFPEGWQRRGSTGQLFEVRNQQWVRIEEKATEFSRSSSQCS